MMNPRYSFTIFFVVAILAFALNQEVVAQGKLSRVRGEVRKHDPPKSSDNQSSRSRDDDRDDDRRSNRRDRDRDSNRSCRPNRRRRGNAFGGAVFGTFIQPTPVVNRVTIIESPPQMPPVIPYASPVDLGLTDAGRVNPIVQPPLEEPVIPATTEGPALVEPARQQGIYQSVVDPVPGSWQPDFMQWGARITAFGGGDFDDIVIGGFSLLAQSPGSIGLDTSVNVFRETGMDFRDALWIGDVNVVYEGLVGDVRGRLGLGVNWLGDSFGGEAGFNLTAGFDWRLSHRWTATTELDLGTLGDSDLFHFQASLGRSFQNAEWVFGYDYYDIGGTVLGNAFTGLRFRF